MRHWMFSGLLVLLFCSSCLNNDDDFQTQFEIDQERINQYLEDNNLDATLHETGIHYIITEEGTGENPLPTDSVEVKYKGYLLDGTVFDQTPADTTVVFDLPGVILGWQIGIPLFSKEGKGTLIIPSDYGYGRAQIGSIPANSVLVFDVELVDFWE